MSKAFGAETFASPQPDASRVAQLRHAFDATDEAAVAALGAQAHADLAALVERLLAEVRTTDVVAAAADLEQIGARAALDPAALTPRGLFDSRRRALARFIDRFHEACRAVDPLIASLGERLSGARRRVEALDALHEQAKTFILEFDAHLEAGRQRLAALEPAHAAAPALDRRLRELHAVRRVALEQLSCVRVVQNVDTRLQDVLDRAIAAAREWRRDWSDRLGMRLDRRVAIRPDATALQDSRAALAEALTALLPAIAEASARREEAAARMSRAAEALRVRQA